jgi:hypothetical protein
MRRCLLSLFLLFILAAAAAAQFGSASQNTPGVQLHGRNFGDLYAAQKTLLSNYCRLDFEGARLQAAGWNRFKAYTSMRTNPEFSRVVVVTRFDIETPEQPTETLYASYKVVGFYDENDGYSAASANERVTFKVQEQKGALLVTEVAPGTPHVSPRGALAWMNLRLADPKITDLERAHLQDAVNQLNRLVAPPKAATATPGA